jgi:hypothetical protein
MATRREATELLIIDRVLCGDLPRRCDRHSVSSARGVGRSCTCCGRAITYNQIQYDVALGSSADGLSLPMHLDCYTAWSSISAAIECSRPGGEAILGTSAECTNKRVFLVAYSYELLVTCSTILRSRGYTVTSVVGNRAARCSLQAGGPPHSLFIVGSAAPDEARLEMSHWLRLRYPDAMILMLHATTDQSGRDFASSTNSRATAVWLPAVSPPPLLAAVDS